MNLPGIATLARGRATPRSSCCTAWAAAGRLAACDGRAGRGGLPRDRLGHAGLRRVGADRALTTPDWRRPVRAIEPPAPASTWCSVTAWAAWWRRNWSRPAGPGSRPDPVGHLARIRQARRRLAAAVPCASRFAPLDAGRGMAGLAPELVAGMVGPGRPRRRGAGRGACDGTGARGHLPRGAVGHRLLRPPCRPPGDRSADPVPRGRARPQMCHARGDGRWPRASPARATCALGIGHLANLEAPAAFNAAVLEFLTTRFPPGDLNGCRHAILLRRDSLRAALHRRRLRRATNKQKNCWRLPPSSGARNSPACRGDRPRRGVPVRELRGHARRRPVANLRAGTIRRLGRRLRHLRDGGPRKSAAIAAPPRFTYNMHVCSTMWSGFIADDLDMSPRARAARAHPRHPLQAHRRGRQGLFAAVFRGGAAAAGKAPVGHRWRAGRRRLRRQRTQIFASLAGAADYYGILCTLDKPGAAARLDVPGGGRRSCPASPSPATGIRWACAARCRAPSSSGRVRSRDRAPDARRHLYAQAAMRWPHMFATAVADHHGHRAGIHDFTVQYLRGEVPGMPPVKRRMYPTKQVAVAR